MIDTLAGVVAPVETTSREFPLWMIGLLGLGIGAAVLAFRRIESADHSD